MPVTLARPSGEVCGVLRESIHWGRPSLSSVGCRGHVISDRLFGLLRSTKLTRLRHRILALPSEFFVGVAGHLIVVVERPKTMKTLGNNSSSLSAALPPWLGPNGFLEGWTPMQSCFLGPRLSSICFSVWPLPTWGSGIWVLPDRLCVPAVLRTAFGMVTWWRPYVSEAAGNFRAPWSSACRRGCCAQASFC